MPEITVLMPVRNGEKYIKESIDSVLNQTLTDFEFLIIDDGSTDRTVEIIQGYTDKRNKKEKRRKRKKVLRIINKKPDIVIQYMEKMKMMTTMMTIMMMTMMMITMRSQSANHSVVRKHSRKKILRSNSLLQKNRKHLQNLIPRLRRCVHQKRIREEMLLWKYV